MKVSAVCHRIIGFVLIALGGIFSSPAMAQSQFIVHASATTISSVADRHGCTVAGRVDSLGIFLFQAPAGSDPDVVLADLEQDADLTAVEPDDKVFIPEAVQAAQLTQSTASILGALSNKTLVPYFGAQVWSAYINQPAATIIELANAQTTYGTTGAGIVAVIDTGVDPQHSVLQTALVTGFDFTRNVSGDASDWADLTQSTASILDQSTVSILDGTNTVVMLNQSTASILDQSTASILDTTKVPKSFGHGTMVAGLIHLVAPTAKIMPLKAFNADGSSDLFNILQAIYYAAQNGARVINMSFSLSGSSQEFARAVAFAVKHGVTCVASAGNSGQEVLVYPAALRTVIGVASTNNQDVRSTFSNYGPSLVTLAAPGEGLITIYPGNHYAAAWGTSFSTPLVAGGAALFLQLDSSISPDRIADSFSNAVKISEDLGAGRLDLVLAIASRVKN